MDKLGSYFLPPAKSTIASDIDALFNFVNLVSLILFLSILAAMIYFVIRYRRRSIDDVTSLNDHNNTLEVVWTIIPLFLIIFVFYWGFTDYLKLKTPPGDAYEIHVDGKKWLWSFKYSTGVSTTNELHVPVNTPVKLIMSSSDVIHSFYIPDFRIKHDVLPNRYTLVWFEAIEEGEYQIYCTEFCGTGHSDMLAKVIVHTKDGFNQWLKDSGGRPSDVPLAEYGKQLMAKQGCQTCHSLDGSQLVGPSFKGLFGKNRTFSDGSSATADENYIRNSILNPNSQVVEGFLGVMPSYQGLLSDDDLNSIVEFIKTVN